MKKILRNTLLISLAFILIGCSKTQSKEKILQEKYKVIESSFDAYCSLYNWIKSSLLKNNETLYELINQSPKMFRFSLLLIEST